MFHTFNRLFHNRGIAAAAFNYSAGSGSGGVGDHYGMHESNYLSMMRHESLGCASNLSNEPFITGVQEKLPLRCEMSHCADARFWLFPSGRIDGALISF